ncbi:hypothetical protein CEXT_352401 [Caerostris extrusa]|uniref:Uncharacterized protein n=1 Tax=Caerostris extrusa TaxID=172846 RepID=A0AAV4V0E4_CAEEX|nr:hypothetical protein CEXT_352401 [Caerostris extrusa]
MLKRKEMSQKTSKLSAQVLFQWELGPFLHRTLFRTCNARTFPHWDKTVSQVSPFLPEEKKGEETKKKKKEKKENTAQVSIDLVTEVFTCG